MTYHCRLQADVKLAKSDNQINGKIVKADYIQVDFYVTPLKAVIFFPPCQYRVDKSPGAPYFIASIKEFIAELQKMDEFKNLTLSGEFEGGADGAGASNIVGKYKGEFGTINEDGVIINGQTANIFLSKGNPITNLDLAFLRAYSVYDALIRLIQNIGMGKQNFTSIKFIANEYKEHGDKYRFGRITLEAKQDKRIKI